MIQYNDKSIAENFLHGAEDLQYDLLFTTKSNLKRLVSLVFPVDDVETEEGPVGPFDTFDEFYYMSGTMRAYFFMEILGSMVGDDVDKCKASFGRDQHELAQAAMRHNPDILNIDRLIGHFTPYIHKYVAAREAIHHLNVLRADSNVFVHSGFRSQRLQHMRDANSSAQGGAWMAYRAIRDNEIDHRLTERQDAWVGGLIDAINYFPPAGKHLGKSNDDSISFMADGVGGCISN